MFDGVRRCITTSAQPVSPNANEESGNAGRVEVYESPQYAKPAKGDVAD